MGEKKMIRTILTAFLLLLFISPLQAEESKPKAPEFTFNAPQIEGLHDYFAQYEEKLRSNFMDDYEHTLAEPDITFTNPWVLEVTGEKTYHGKFIAVFLGGYDYRGGAHGLAYLDVIYFDAESKEEIPQSDLLEDEALEKLSALCRQGLIEQGFQRKDEWMLEGTEPFEKNFKVLVPREDSVDLIFPPYQIGPYSAGAPEVKLSWETVGPLLNPKYRP